MNRPSSPPSIGHRGVSRADWLLLGLAAAIPFVSLALAPSSYLSSWLALTCWPAVGGCLLAWGHERYLGTWKEIGIAAMAVIALYVAFLVVMLLFFGSDTFHLTPRELVYAHASRIAIVLLIAVPVLVLSSIRLALRRLLQPPAPPRPQ